MTPLGARFYNLCAANRAKGRYGGNPYHRKKALNMSGKNVWGNKVVPKLSKENQVIWGRELREKERICTRCGPLVESLQTPPQGHETDPRLSASPGETVVTNS